ncbi:MAG TPA: putative 2OG-Fe(II) oxygenase [Parvularculaceae bacterium]|nr:putative 2OG-Fe(II) oxygenase [Amphiplicatus sp.]HPE30679.1 putative 2OG-Fe(II) oxygenase [Parvularculaceae bacterium]HRX39286.1 putative 2OG-Fe(II) oxygenase [Parvularculaceae bacterium]
MTAVSATPVRTTRHDLFPTTVMTFEHAEDAMNEEIARHFETHPRYARADQAEQSDSLNLMDLVEEAPALARLQGLFTDALKAYCAAAGVSGGYNVAMQMFPNVAPARHYVPSHNHVAHIAAVYYVQTPPFENRPLVDHASSMTDYWRPEEGVLIFHDPRFNASLNGLWQSYARVYPRPGVLVMFPAFLWHEVTPHFSNSARLSVAANFTLEARDSEAFQRSFAIELG